MILEFYETGKDLVLMKSGTEVQTHVESQDNELICPESHSGQALSSHSP